VNGWLLLCPESPGLWGKSWGGKKESIDALIQARGPPESSCRGDSRS